MFNLDKREEGKRIINEARASVIDTMSLEGWYCRNGFKWKKDVVNCYSKPWLTAARRGGDCEDIALLSWEILKGKKRCIMATCHGRKDGKRRGHAVLLVYEDAMWRVMSNMYRTTKHLSIEKAAESVYKENTIDYFFVR